MPKVDVTMMYAVKTVRRFVDSNTQSTTKLVTPDGHVLHCDWGYVLDGLDEIERYLRGETQEDEDAED